MSLNYSISQPVPIFGTKSTTTNVIATTATLTASLAGNRKVIDGVTGMTKFDLRYAYTTGASETSNQLNIVIEQSEDLENWFTIANETVSAGTSTLNARTFVNLDNATGATTINSSIGLDIFYKALRVSMSETGVVTNFGTVYAEGTILGE